MGEQRRSLKEKIKNDRPKDRRKINGKEKMEQGDMSFKICVIYKTN
ncbi:MAG: hypothetical protein UHS41_10430 [Lachnospiraceae bacterium]|nr:hypothetical protein [Lachnospiraceae bacterium]